MSSNYSVSIRKIPQKTWLSLLFLLCLLAVLALPGLAQQPELPGDPGISGVASLRGTLDLAEIAIQLEPDALSEAGAAPPYMPVPEASEVISRQGLAQAPLAAASPEPQFTPPSAPSFDSPGPAASFFALGDDNTRIPPDTHGAVGPNHLMVTLNSQVRIQDRSGAALSTVSLSAFWASVNPTGGAFDPKVLYDPYAGRWIFTACDDARSTSSGLLIGVSQTNNPAGVWNLYRLPATETNWIDYPSIGFNKDWIVVTVNIFSSTNTYVRSEIYAFSKSDLYAGGAGSYRRFTDNTGTWAPAETYDNTLDMLYLFETYSSSSGLVRMATISGPLGAEVFSTGTVSSWFVAFGSPWSANPAGGVDFAPQLGALQKIQNNDHRIQQVVYRNGALWLTQTIFLPAGGNPTRSGVQWWSIAPNNPPATAPGVLQRGRIEDPSGALFYAFPSIAVNKNNDALLGFSRFSSSQYASGNYALRLAADPANTFRNDVVLKAGETKYYKTYSGTLNRWGDYSRSQVDPQNDIDFWTIQEYAWTPADGYDRWATWWGKIVPDGNIQPPVSRRIYLPIIRQP